MNHPYVFTNEDEQLLLEILKSQSYAFELIACELSDIENGLKEVDLEKLKQLKELYYSLS